MKLVITLLVNVNKSRTSADSLSLNLSILGNVRVMRKQFRYGGEWK
jgi:hypothetical protein